MRKLAFFRPRILSIAALATLTVVGSARAADLDGGCCADLEERIAELEATTARKGGRKLSLTISGWVHEAVFFWDDGVESNVYVGTNTLEQTRLRFNGEAKIDGEWSAGYLIEIGAFGHASGRWDQDTQASAASNSVLLRRSHWYLKSKTFGRFLVGHEGTPTYHLIGDPDIVATRYYGDAEAGGAAQARFFIRSNGARVGGLRWSDILGGVNSGTPGQIGRHNVVRYDTPEIFGFIANASWGEDDMWGGSLAFRKDIGDFRLAAKIGYEHNSDSTVEVCNRTNPNLECEWWGVGGTVHHVPTGLFVYGAYGEQIDQSEERINPLADGTDTTFDFEAGIEKAFIPLGKTTVYGEYRKDEAGSNLGKSFGGSFIHDSEIEFWGAGIIQNLEAASMDVYAIYRHAEGTSTNAAGASINIDDFDVLISGARIVF